MEVKMYINYEWQAQAAKERIKSRMRQAEAHRQGKLLEGHERSATLNKKVLTLLLFVLLLSSLLIGAALLSPAA
jgi:hypothetical protein